MKIRTKIILGYSALMILVSSVVFYQQWGLSDFEEGFRSFEKKVDTARSADLINSAVTALTNNNDQLREFFQRIYLKPQSSRQVEFNKFILDDLVKKEAEEIEEQSRIFEDNLKELRQAQSDGPGGESVKKLGAIWEQYRRAQAEIDQKIKAFSPNNPPSLQPLFADQLDRLGRLIDEDKDLLGQIQADIQRMTDNGNATSARVRRVSRILIGAAFVLSVALIVIVVMSIQRPLKRLIAATHELAGGNFGYRLEEKGASELASLALSFNEMAGRLEHSEDLKREFLAGISHDLKAPLASMQDASKILLEEIAGPMTDDQRELIALSLQSGERLGKLIGDLLDLSKMEAGAMLYDFSRQDLVELTESLTEEVRPRVREEGIGLICRISSQELPIQCDPGRIKQVLSNLLENAIKFTSRNSCIEVTLALTNNSSEDGDRDVFQAQGAQALLSVIDYGPGVPDDHKQAIFAKFHQVERDRSSHGAGAGLGLSICNNIVQAHGGAVWVEDNPAGGSIFRVILPTLLPRLDQGQVSDAA